VDLHGVFTADEDLSASFVPDDKERRLHFDRELARYVRSHRERWDITALLEPLQLLRAKTGQVQVTLHRSAQGRLAVMLRFELQPTACGRRASDRRLSDQDILH
jgi:hypothetical protein